MEQKKQTNAQLQRRIANAVVHIDKDKSYQSVYWSDKGLRLETTDEREAAFQDHTCTPSE